ncbi:MAG: hypothetical protein ACR2PA_21250, partial [Hyphomicrobiaceae bacterium]
ALIDERRTLYEYAREHCRDIASAVALMMLAREPDELLDAAARRVDVFIMLGELAHIHRCESVARALQERFGPDWLKSYGRRRKEYHWLVPPP